MQVHQCYEHHGRQRDEALSREGRMRIETQAEVFNIHIADSEIGKLTGEQASVKNYLHNIADNAH